MSYDIHLLDPVSRDVITFDGVHTMSGGTFALAGTCDAWLNVTWNYAPFYYRTMGEKGIRTIYGMSGADSIPVLEDAAAKLGDDTSNNYWDATEGNAKRPLFQLIALAKMRPDGIWDGD